jgi:hypothetical protein
VVQIDKMTEQELGWHLNPPPCPENRLSHEEKKRIRKERRKRQRREEEEAALDAAVRAALEEAEAADVKQELQPKAEPEQKPAPFLGPKDEPKLLFKLERKVEPGIKVDAVPKVEANEVDDSCVIVVENNVDVIVLD